MIHIVGVKYGDAPVTIRCGARIARLVVATVARAVFVVVNEFPRSDLRPGWFGSAGR